MLNFEIFIGKPVFYVWKYFVDFFSGLYRWTGEASGAAIQWVVSKARCTLRKPGPLLPKEQSSKINRSTSHSGTVCSCQRREHGCKVRPEEYNFFILPKYGRLVKFSIWLVAPHLVTTSTLVPTTVVFNSQDEAQYSKIHAERIEGLCYWCLYVLNK